MNVLDDILRRVTKAGVFIGGVFLIACMLMQMVNIIGRPIHFVLPWSYEMFEMFMAIPVAFALVYAALQKAHVVVNLLTSKFPPKLSAASEILAAFLSMVTWAMIAWGGAELAYESGLEEVTDILGFPKLPFRVVWVFCLILFCLTYLVDLSGHSGGY